MQCRLSQLTAACRYYNVKRSGSKPEVVERILDFLITASRDERSQLSNALNSGVASPIGTRNRSPPWLTARDGQQREAESQPVDATAKFTPPSLEVKSMFANIDAFHPIAPVTHPFLFCSPCKHGSTSFSLDLAELKNMRRQGYSVWIRCISKTAGRNERHVWPKELRVFVNMTQVLKIEEPRKLKKRRDEPSELTAYLQSGKNQIQISVSDPSPSNFTVALVVCGSLSNHNIINTIPAQSSEACRERMKRILDIKSDLLVEDTVDGFRPLDLRCPISLGRISIPAHGTGCSHIRCFDLNAYVSVNRQTSNINLRWTCPICQKVTYPRDLIVDSYVKEIIGSTSENEIEVVLDESTGDWRHLSVEQEATRRGDGGDDPEDSDEELFKTEGNVEEPIVEKMEEVEIVDLDDDIPDETPPQKRQKPELPSLSLPPGRQEDKPLDVIELD